jgi:uncharacterized protein (DUF885 family)
MTRLSAKTSLGLALAVLAACNAPTAPTAPTAPAAATAATAATAASGAQVANVGAPRDNLNTVVERYWDEHVPSGNPLSPQYLADSLAVERRFLAEVLAIPRTSLDADGRLSYDIFRKQRESNIEGLTYPAELLPVNPFDGMPQHLARTAAGLAEHPSKSAGDYENWRLQIDDYVEWTRQAIANMRDGMRRGYTSPRVLMVRLLPLLQRYGEDISDNVFYSPGLALPQSIQEPERTRLATGLTGAVKDKLLPAFRELHDFILREYLPRARAGLALSALPLGPAWYAALVRRATSTQLTPDEIHSIGLAETELIRARLQASAPGAPPTGAVAQLPPAGGVPLLDAYQELKGKTLAAMPALFSALPRRNFEIRTLGRWSETAPRLAYQPAAPGNREPPILYVNTASSPARPANVEIAGFLQEAVPGRHYQSAIQQERTDLPKFRRFASEPAFADGWALYAVSLGDELGLYGDDEAKRGALVAQQKCAAALVVDTGLHAKDWTRSQAAGYLRAQLALDDADANLMTDRFAAFPASAVACKIGELRIQALRRRALEVLGPRFDIREFHSEILKDGAMPLDILEAKMKLWMEAQR